VLVRLAEDGMAILLISNEVEEILGLAHRVLVMRAGRLVAELSGADMTEEAIVSAMRYVWERMKIVIEPSAAVPIGALLEKKIDLTGKRIGVILSGGNVSLERLPDAGTHFMR